MLLKNKLRRAVAVAAALAVLGVIFPQAALAQDKFMKGVWVSTVYNIDYPKAATTNIEWLMNEADEVLNDCKDLGFNTVFLQVHPTGDALYSSDIFPYSRWLTGSEGTAPDGDIDILEYWIYCAHERGMELHAWINPYRITIGNAPLTSLSPDNPARQHPEYIVEYKGNYYYNPALPEVRDLITDCAVELAEKYPVDGIHMDDYFYPGDIDDYDDYMAFNTDDLSLEDWRRSNCDALVAEVSGAMRERNVTFGISPRGIWANKTIDPRGSDTNGGGSYNTIYADSLKWVREGLVDYIAPQIYWEIGNSAADYETLLGWWSDAVDGTDVKLYIGMADYKADEAKEGSVWYGGTPLKEEFYLNDVYGTVDGEIHFSYTNVAGNQTLWDIVSERNYSLGGDEQTYNNEENHTPAIDIIREYGLFNGYESDKFSDWFIVMLQNLILQHRFN